MARRPQRVIQERPVEWIRHAMQLSGVSPTQLSRRMQTGHSHLSRILSLKKDFRVSTLFSIIAACGFEIVELRVRRKPN